MPLFRPLTSTLATLSLCLAPSLLLWAQTPAPRLVSENGRHALLVDGAPYLVLGAQIGNSSAWPAVLSQVWPALEATHVNTGEAPVYWEQIEPQPGQFDWTNVDALIEGARAHHLHLVLLWFGTWKNGNDHYVPQWIKRDPQHFPRMLNSAGNPIDDLSANSPVNMEADRKAFAALMHHVAEKDGTEHTVIMIQVENESGGIGSARDYSAASNREFAGQVPSELVKALGRKGGTWSQVFGGNADEAFQAWHQARYVNAVAEAGKRELNIPFYCNVWLAYPPAALPERHIATAGIGYPSGGPNQGMLNIWKAAAPSIDMIGPDLYSSNPEFILSIFDIYARPDNPLWIPETGQSNDYAGFFFAALDKGAIGFSPFGVDWTGWLPTGTVPRAHAANFALLGPMDRTIAQLVYAGKVKTFVESAGGVDQEKVFAGKTSGRASDAAGGALISPVTLANALVPLDEAGTAETRAADAGGAWVAEARFGFPQRDGEAAPGSPAKEGRLLVAQLGPDEFLLTGIGGNVFFHRPGYLPGIRMQILTAEEGYYTPGATPGAAEVWHVTRVLNGDETDRGIRFPDPSARPPGGNQAAASQPVSGDPPPPVSTRSGPMAVHLVLGRF
ncbi:MAG TPA: DUF5597 domain-containing protein [Acidobacteriaceae bacterium]